jgi:hypothetical protein
MTCVCGCSVENLTPQCNDYKVHCESKLVLLRGGNGVEKDGERLV